MLNMSLIKSWENWFIIFLMISIPLVGLHSFINYIDTEN